MKIVMAFPSLDSEKALSNYSIHLLRSIKKRVNIEELTYTAGSPETFFKKINKLYPYDVIHLQHEYNLLGLYGTPFFLVLFLLRVFKKGALVITMHTVNSQKASFRENLLKNFMRKMLYIFQNRLIRWASDAIIVHEQFYKDLLMKEYGFPKNKIHVIPQGVIGDIELTDKKKRLQKSHKK